MLRKFSSVVFGCALAVSMIGCEQADDSVDAAADQANEVIEDGAAAAENVGEEVNEDLDEGAEALQGVAEEAAENANKAADAVTGE